MGRKAVFQAFSRGGGHGIMKKTIPGGACHAEGQMESEHRLHIGAAAGEPAADLPLRPDHRGGPDGLREDHGGELVSRASAPRRRRCASSASACIPTTSPSSGGACRTPLPARGLTFLRDYPCPTDAAGGGLLADDLCHELAGDVPCYPVYRRLPPADRRARRRRFSARWQTACRRTST